MRTIILLLSLFVATATMAADSSPFHPADDARFRKLENEQTLRVVYDVAANSGAVGAHGLGQYLPAKAIITKSFYYIVTQFSDSGTGTVAVSCEDANNILTAADITGFSAGTLHDGNQSGVASAMTGGIAAPCQVKATVATADQLTGKLIFWIKYVIGQ